MNFELISLLLLSGLMSTISHTFIKMGSDRFLTFTTINIIAAIPAIILALISPIPKIDCLPYLILSIIIHNIQKLCMLQAYRFGDLSRAYPLMRGISPILITVSALLFLGEKPQTMAILSLILITGSLISLGFGEGRLKKTESKALIFALTTGSLTAAYTIIDGIGARLSGNSISFIAWLYILDAIPFTTAALIVKKRELSNFILSNWGKSIIGGALSILSYGIVIFALTKGAMGAVAALRESSILYSAIIGVIFLKEPFGKRRAIAAAFITLGVIGLAA